MKARVQETIRQKAVKAEFDKHAEEYANHVAQSMAALMAYLMCEKWRCSPDTCRRRVQDIADMLSAPQIFGQDIHDTDYINWCRKELDLDVEEIIKLRVAVEYV